MQGNVPEAIRNCVDSINNALLKMGGKSLTQKEFKYLLREVLTIDPVTGKVSLSL